ncbi:hypothetical protein [Nonomuraea sp. B19D2]|uniref:hypothetical protein n=1 Tax=Nonomuraea sp. B19D2 TaxID=3159561 RepID=UPI0032DB3912
MSRGELPKPARPKPEDGWEHFVNQPDGEQAKAVLAEILNFSRGEMLRHRRDAEGHGTYPHDLTELRHLVPTWWGQWRGQNAVQNYGMVLVQEHLSPELVL